MADRSSGPTDNDSHLFGIDPSVARAARLQNYLAGGDGNFTSDRDVARRLGDVTPGGTDAVLAMLRTWERSVERVVRYLADRVGIRQFLYIDTAVPTENDVDEIAQSGAPESRVVYVGSDPVVLAHAHVLRGRSTPGARAYVHGTLHDPERILRDAAATLDLTLPVAAMLGVTLSFVPDERDPHDLVARLVDGLPSGSHLAIHHATTDIAAEGVADALKWLDESLREGFVARSYAEISRFFSGLELVDPGIVPINHWHGPDVQPGVPDPEKPMAPAYAGVARKP